MGVLLALGSALCYGLTHFLSGVLSRRDHGMTVALYAQVGGTLVSIVPALALPTGPPTAAAFGWGAASGLGAGLGVALLYRGMGRGRMTVVAPVGDVSAAALPVLFGMAVLGERLPAVAAAGVALAVPAIWLIARPASAPRPGAPSRTAKDAGSVPSTSLHAPVTAPTRGAGAGAERRVSGEPACAGPARGASVRRGLLAGGDAVTRRSVRDGLLGGAGIALNYIGLAQIPDDGGLWPFVVTRAVSVVAVLGLVLVLRAPRRMAPAATLRAAATGTVGTLAALLFLLATQQHLLAISTVLASLYPAVTVALAVVVLRERLGRFRTLGIALALLAVALCAIP